MTVHQGHPIDLSSEYPCPCRRNGCLKPIALTEAFGCDRCQHFFILQENYQQLEQLATHYPYRRAWRWNGQQWVPIHSKLRDSYVMLLLAIMVMVLIMGLVLTLQSSPKLTILFWVLLALLLAILPIFMVWLAHWY